MTGDPGLDAVIERYHAAAAEFIKGNVEPYLALFSHADDVCVANPFNPSARGWPDVSQTIRRACALWAEGEVVGFDRVVQVATSELAYIVEFERYRAKIGGSDQVTSVELRVTSALRLEDGDWKVLLRHADPITTARPPTSVVAD
jgi:ketosteroid isomerase-like protein